MNFLINAPIKKLKINTDKNELKLSMFICVYLCFIEKIL